ncbi:hypothetical protein C1645_827903 [Glomus cerebriforme]|uniref:Uncharacterized protein n=1 Tax=Glomus cerebriforme TaxID=658196 RepID=A0A397SRT1_9GLOM|nr:hypothetical protein C1645_827903 [Glomus cerebriforme]
MIKKLFAIALYSAFVNNKQLTPIRDIWKNIWVMGTAAISAAGLIGLLISPIILTAIIHVLGFGKGGIAANSFAAWFMSLYKGIVESGSLISVLQSIGAASGSKLTTYFNELELNDHEKQMLGNLVQIEDDIYQNNHMITFKLMSALLRNDIMLKCFVETFLTCPSFVECKLFRFDFKESYLTMLKSEQTKVNNIIYNLLVSYYEESRVKYNFHDDNLIGYDLDLNNYQSSNKMMNLLVEIWNYINGNIVLNINIDKIWGQLQDQFNKFSNYFHKIRKSNL